MDIKDALTKLQPTTKAARLRALLPDIERQLAAGVQLKAIQAALHSGGLELTLATLKTYVYRFRQAAHHPAIGVTNVVVASPASTQEPVTDQPVSVQDLARLMQPDAQQEATDIAHYERIAKQQRKENKPV
ncbi:hypothetical protein ACXX82_00315 [Glaciimonas sp. GNP009]